MRRAQSFIAVLSVAVGVAAFLLVAALQAWQARQIAALAAEFAPDVLVVRQPSVYPPDFEFTGLNSGITFEESRSLSGLPGVGAVAFAGSQSRVLGERLSIARMPVSEELFGVLGLEFAAGEGFDERARLLGLPFVVIGDTVAREVFGGPEAAVGEMVSLGMGSARVVGVLAPVPEAITEFRYLDVAALVPSSPAFELVNPNNPRPADSMLFVKHLPGERALAEASLRAALDELPTAWVYEVVGSEVWLGSQQVFRNRVADELSRGSRWIVLLVLIAAVGNLANFMGLRVADRAREAALRRAVGATRGRVLVGVAGDALLLGGAGTLLGVALWPLLDRLARVGEGPLPVTWQAFALAGGMGLAITLLASLVPALWLLRVPIYKALREELSPPVWEGVALTGMAAGVLALMVASFIQGGTEDWFQARLREVGADRVVMTTIGGPSELRRSSLSKPPFTEREARDIAALPGVAGVATVAHDSLGVVVRSGAGQEADYYSASVARVTPELFDIFPRPIAVGRAPAAADEVLVGPDAAAKAFPGLSLEEVVGRSLRIGQQVLAAGGQGGVTQVEEFTVVGVAAPATWSSFGDLSDVVIVRLQRESDPPLAGSRDLHVRVDLTADFEATLASIRGLVRKRYPDYAEPELHEPAGDLRQVRATMREVGASWGVMAWLALAVGGGGLASLVMVRLFRQRPQVALKRAVGATKRRLTLESLALSARTAVGAALTGLVAAVAVSYWVARLAPWSFGWSWANALLVTGVAVGVALLVALPPTLSFMRVQPWKVLRSE
ncbi:MAG: ABC transporter permease [Trueperaceae bacterium]|nr:ABC transporter permease [Trueperaceae bacterium]